MSFSRLLADFVLSDYCFSVPEQVRVLARHSIIDCLGCILAGSKEKSSGIISDYVYSPGENGASTVIGRNFKTNPYNAAMANGFSGHILDYDDMSAALMGHPSTVVLPAVLAVGEQEGISGQKALEAFIIGTEAACAVGKAVQPGHYKNGWHPTSTVGIFGATAAAGRILNLSRDELVNAFGIAASESSGLRQNFGTLTKPFHAGRAAAKGILAASLAKKGLTSAKQIFEGEAGFFNTMCGSANISMPEKLGQQSAFISPGISIKPYPSCAATHNGIDAALHLAGQYNIKPGDIKSIDCGVMPIAKDILIYPRPSTGLEAKFSMNFCVALAIAEREVGLRQFSDQKTRDSLIKSLGDKMNFFVHPELAKLGYRGTLSVILKITTENNDQFTHRVDYTRGDPENPLTENEIIDKYVECASQVIEQTIIDKSLQMLLHLSDLEQIGELLNLLGGKEQ